MKYVIKLRSRHTGEEIWLGSQYDSPKAAKSYAEKEVCNDCNSYGKFWCGLSEVFAGKYTIYALNYLLMLLKKVYTPHKTPIYERIKYIYRSRIS